MSEAEQFKADFDRILEAGVTSTFDYCSGACGADVVYGALRAMQKEVEVMYEEKKSERSFAPPKIYAVT